MIPNDPFLAAVLDGAHGDMPLERIARAAHVRCGLLLMFTAAIDVAMPTSTYTVAMPAGQHLYFGTPVEMSCRSAVGALGPRGDSRGAGVAARATLSRGGMRR